MPLEGKKRPNITSRTPPGPPSLVCGGKRSRRALRTRPGLAVLGQLQSLSAAPLGTPKNFQAVNRFTYRRIAPPYSYQHGDRWNCSSKPQTPEENAMIKIITINTLAFAGVLFPFLALQMFGS